MTRGIVLVALLAATGCATTEQRLKKRIDEVHKIAQQRGVALDVQRLAQPHKLGCNAEVQSYNHLVCCDHVKEVLRPSSIAEVERMVHDIAEQHGHLRVVGRMHSSNDQLCPPDGQYVMSLERLSSHYYQRHHGQLAVMVADAGMTLGAFDQILYEQGRTIGMGVIGFRGVTLGGAVATGAHGSSLVDTSILSSRVVYVEIVEADGKLHKYWRDELERAGEGDKFRALSASMGLLGVVVRVGFETRPRFNLQLDVSYDEEKVILQHPVEQDLAGCKFAQLVWFPRANRIMRVCGKDTHDEAESGASSVLLTPKATETEVELFRSLMESTIASGAPLCTIEYERYLQIKRTPPYVHSCCCRTQNTRFVVGPSHQLLSSELTPFHDQLPEIDFEVAVPKSRWQEALNWVNDQVDQHDLCLPLIGIFLRFSKHDENTLIGHASQPEPVMFLEIVVYVREHEPVGAHERYYDKYFSLATELVTRFGARPHWGKNAIELFEAQRQVPGVEDALKKFRAIRAVADPAGLFVNEFARAVGLAE